MLIFQNVAAMQQFLLQKTTHTAKTGFVPTMGALHNGHLSLIKKSKENCNLTICSIFVNPTQFNDPEDFKLYPKTIDSDIEFLVMAGCDVLFLPAVNEIYPSGTADLPRYELGYIETVLEGKYRPGHFQGVCQVMHRLLLAVQPQQLFMGQKDFQQCMVVQKLLEIKNIPTQLIVCPTLRENDGLAMSSRNKRLHTQQRKQAAVIFKTLQLIQQQLPAATFTSVKEKAVNYLQQNEFKVDYVEIAKANTLEPVEHWNGKDQLVALVAAYLNDVRLIDNLLLHE